jgi:hypothetical protein
MDSNQRRQEVFSMLCEERVWTEVRPLLLSWFKTNSSYYADRLEAARYLMIVARKEKRYSVSKATVGEVMDDIKAFVSGGRVRMEIP